MTSLKDLFSDFPDRPDHPDFWKLSEIVLQLDGRAMEDESDFASTLASMMDPKSLCYMARQRAMRLLERGLVSLTSLYIDGFAAGYRYAERKNQEAHTGEEDK